MPTKALIIRIIVTIHALIVFFINVANIAYILKCVAHIYMFVRGCGAHEQNLTVFTM